MGNVSPIVSLQFQWRRYFELTLQGDFVKNNGSATFVIGNKLGHLA